MNQIKEIGIYIGSLSDSCLSFKRTKEKFSIFDVFFHEYLHGSFHLKFEMKRCIQC